MSFEVTVTPTVYNVEVEVNPSVQPFDVVVEVGNVPDLDLTTNGDSGASTFDPLTGELNIPEYTLDGLGGVPETRTITINGTTQDLSADRTFTIPAPDPVTIGSPANGLAIDGSQVLTIGLASGSTDGALSSTDWTTFNGKQNALGFTAENVANKAINLVSPDDTKYPTTLAVSTALAGKQNTLTNPVTGTGVAGQVAFFNGTTTQTGNSNFTYNSTINQLTLGNQINITATAATGIFANYRTFSINSGGVMIFSDSTNANRITFGITTAQSGSNFQIETATGNAGAEVYVRRFQIFNSTGNLLLQNGGTFTDAGFRLDVNGTARVQGALTLQNGWVLGTESIQSSTALVIRTASAGRYLMFARQDASSGFGNFQYIALQSNRCHFIFSSTDFNTSGADASALILLNSTTQGFLPPRLTTTQRNAIATPTTGLEVYNSTNNSKDIYNGSAWVNVVSSSNFDGLDIAFGTSTGTKIGTATSQKLSFWNATPNVQPTTAITAGAFVANTSGITDDTATFDGYTIGQVVAALRRIGALA
jgi:hypothetical protein